MFSVDIFKFYVNFHSRKAEKKLAVMQSKVETAKEREMMTTETLTQVLAVVCLFRI